MRCGCHDDQVADFRQEFFCTVNFGINGFLIQFPYGLALQSNQPVASAHDDIDAILLLPIPSIQRSLCVRMLSPQRSRANFSNIVESEITGSRLPL